LHCARGRGQQRERVRDDLKTDRLEVRGSQ
jgi:hypothetical protein